MQWFSVTRWQPIPGGAGGRGPSDMGSERVPLPPGSPSVGHALNCVLSNLLLCPDGLGAGLGDLVLGLGVGG